MSLVHRCLLSTTALASFAILMSPPQASAQANAPASGVPGAQSTAPAAAGGNSVAEVVVTANKRQESLFSVPAPVTAVLSTTLSRQEAVRLDDYISLVPGLNTFGSQEGQETITIRGISTGASNASNTGVYIDDTPVGGSSSQGFAPDALDLDPSAIQRIEVLRGPQGTLYGANALGGIVKYVTRSPDLQGYHGRVELDGEDIDGGGAGGGGRAYFSGPIVADKLGFSASGFERYDPGFIDNPYLDKTNVNSADVFGGRVALLAKPIDRLTINLSGIYQKAIQRSFTGEFTDNNLSPEGGDYKQYFYANLPARHTVWVTSLSAAYDLGWARVTSISSYERDTNKNNEDATLAYGALAERLLGGAVPNLGQNLLTTTSLEKTTQEIRAVSRPDRFFEWQGGLFFTHENTKTRQNLDAFSTVTQDTIVTPLVYQGLTPAQYTEYAGYADLTFHLTDKLNFLGGVRQSENHQTQYAAASGILAGGSSIQGGTSTDSSTTFLVSPKYTFDPNNMVYVRIASGYRPGGPDNRIPGISTAIPTSFGAETLTNYEAGYKGTFLDRRATLDISGYDIEWSDIQISEVFSGVYETGNAGGARSYGLEAAATLKPVRDLTLAANFAYTHATLTTNAPAINGVAGARLPYSPLYSANVSADYDFPVTSNILGFVGASLNYRGDEVSDFNASGGASYVRPVLPSFNTVDLRAGCDKGPYELELYVKNLNNAVGLTDLRSLAANGVSAPLQAAVITPRTFGMSVSAKF